MDFRFSPREEELRSELRSFLREELPPGGIASTVSMDGTTEEQWEFARAFNKKLAARGWIAPSWPAAYGGMGASKIEQLIFKEELAYHRAPDGGRIFGVDMLGPALILHGTDDQRREFLPPIASGDVVWCQGFSEPGSGSDLASLRTSAERDGDTYILNGQKVWTTGAHRADWMFLLARTDASAPKHRGMSFLLLNMETPGVSVRPILNMTGTHEFNEVFFDQVRVPVSNRIGEEHQGWYVAMTLLDFERSSVGAVAAGRRMLEEVVAYLQLQQHEIRPAIRSELAELWIACEVGRLMNYRIASMLETGVIPDYEASMAKVFGTELNQRIYNFALGAVGAYGQLLEGSEWSVLQGRIEREYLENTATTVYSGTSEVQRNIIATRGLGLPR